MFIEEWKKHDIGIVLIVSESQLAVGILQLGSANKSYQKSAMDIQQSLTMLEEGGMHVKN